MLADYRTWLESELTSLGNAKDRDDASGQAHMAERAIARFDDETAGRIVLVFDRVQAAAITTALEMLAERTSALPPELADLRTRLQAGFSETGGAGADAEPHPERTLEKPS